MICVGYILLHYLVYLKLQCEIVLRSIGDASNDYRIQSKDSKPNLYIIKFSPELAKP